jgi:hypothetical protein
VRIKANNMNKKRSLRNLFLMTITRLQPYYFLIFQNTKWIVSSARPCIK